METMIQCPRCQEELNQADWEANQGCCLHCGRSIESTAHWVRQRRGLGILRSRLDLRSPDLRRVTIPSRSLAALSGRRIYA